MPNYKDALFHISAENAGIYQAITTNTTTVGSVIDLDNSIADVVLFNLKCVARTDGSYLPLIEMSTDGSTFTPVADTYLRFKNADGSYTETGQEALATLNAVGSKQLGYVPQARYVRLSLVSTGVTSGATIVTTVAFEKRNKK
jgi:hypothetical protein